MEQHRHTNNAPGMVSLTVLNSRPPVVKVCTPYLWQNQGHGLPGDVGYLEVVPCKVSSSECLPSLQGLGSCT